MNNITQVWLKPHFETIPTDLKAQPWAVWNAEPRGGKLGKFNKAPLSPKTGDNIGVNKPHQFGTFDEAKAAYETGIYTGVGILMTGNGIIGVDIDDCKVTFANQVTVKQWVNDAIKLGAYCEYSPSGNGLRLFMYGNLPDKGIKAGSVEIYDNVRFLTVTGHVANKLSGWA